MQGECGLSFKKATWLTVNCLRSVADLHFAVNNGSCRDTPKNPCIGDPDTLELMGHALDREKPDLVVCVLLSMNSDGLCC